MPACSSAEPRKRSAFSSAPNRSINYDLSDKGHAAWTPDPNQPGYGNFCFGHFNVTAIDNAIPNDPSNPTQYTVNYRYEVEGIPAWASTPESMRTFPKIAADTSIQTATATLVKGTNGGWAVVPPLTTRAIANRSLPLLPSVERLTHAQPRILAPCFR